MVLEGSEYDRKVRQCITGPAVHDLQAPAPVSHASASTSIVEAADAHNPTKYVSASRSIVYYRCNGSEMELFAWEHIFHDFHKLSQATQLDATTGDLKKLTAPSTVQPSIEKFKKFTEMQSFPGLQHEEIRDLFERVVKFVISRKMFPSAAQPDLSEYFQRWSALFQRICEIKETDVPLAERLTAVNYVFQMLDLSGRMVVKKHRPFSAFDFKGDEAAYDRASQFVVNMEANQAFAAMYMSCMATQLTNLNTEPAKLFAAAIRIAVQRSAAPRPDTDFQSVGAGGRGPGRGGGRGGGRDGGRFLWRPPHYHDSAHPPHQPLKRNYPGNPPQ
jgi:hypothetical protein